MTKIKIEVSSHKPRRRSI